MIDFYKNNPADKIFWVDDVETIGQPRFSFDKKEIFYVFRDYPEKLTKKQKELFDKENPFWADFLKGR